MQDEINERMVQQGTQVGMKVIALSVRAGKMTGEALKKAMLEFLNGNKTVQGEQTIAQLMKQNTGLTNIEVTDGNIKSFEHTARKYGIDYALKKDTSEQPPRYLVFFKGRDVDVMTQAFKEFSARTIKQKEKPSLRQKLSRQKEQSKSQHREQAKVKSKDRGVEL